MAVKPVAAGSLKVGSYIVIDGEPCRIVERAKSKPGKHGSAKVRIVAMGIFDNVKRSLVSPTDTKVDVPIVDKRKGQVLYVGRDTVQLMDTETYSTFEISIPEELRGKLSPGAEVLYWNVVGRRHIVQVKG